MWNAKEHTHDENVMWTWLRAVEWGSWPIFLSQPIAPIALLIFPWWSVMIVTTSANVVWTLFIGHRFANPTLAFLGRAFVSLKWLTCPIAAFMVCRNGDWGTGTLAFLWPLLAAIMPRSSAKIGAIQKMFMQSINCEQGGIDLPPQAQGEGVQPEVNSASLSIGGYQLNTSIRTMQSEEELEEFSETEYSVFGRHFRNEKCYNASEVDFLNRQWKVALGSVDDNIYKIAFFFETHSKETAIDVYSQVMQYLEKRMGQPTTEDEDLYAWDRSDGNVIMQLGKILGVGSTYTIGLYQTSNRAATFRPVQ